MIIELNISALKTSARTALEEGVVTRVIQQNLEAICKKHQEAAAKEMQDFVAHVVTKNEIGFALDSTIVKITIPELKA